MAYSAAVSLKQTLKRLAVSIAPPSLETLIHAFAEVESLEQYRETVELIASPMEELKSLQQVLQRLDNSSRSRSRRLIALDGEMREAINKLEDVLEIHELNQFLSECPWSFPNVLCLDLMEVRQEIDLFVETVKKLKDEYIEELENPLPEEDDETAAAESSPAVVSSVCIDFGVDMVGFCDEFVDLRSQLVKRNRPYDYGVYSLFGMVGTGRTVTARAIFEDLYVLQQQSFDCGAWVTVGPNYQPKEILVSIIAQINNHVPEEDEESIAEYLYASLKGRKYMIVLEDVQDTRIKDLSTRSFPEQNNGSFVLLTTAMKEIAEFGDSFHMAVLDEQFAWDMLRMAMFGEHSCPLGLEEAGKKIVENCGGLRIPLVKVILHLWKAEKTPEYWNNFAANKGSSIFQVADEVFEIHKISEDIELYNSLPNNDESTFVITMAASLLDLSDPIRAMKMHLFPERLVPQMEIISIIGMAGIGKTTIVKKLFEDPSILRRFDHRVWVTLGPKYKSEDILIDILAELYPAIDKMQVERDEKLAEDLCSQLSDKICLIVLDDVWNQEPMHYLKKLVPNMKGEILVTTRLVKVAHLGQFDKLCRMRLLNNEESWKLFCRKVFAEESCPPELVKVGKKISEICEGLPLLILTVADSLSKFEKTSEYWNEVAEKQNSVFMEAYESISKVLYPSYEYLPQHLKACFLYTGAFRQTSEISRSKLIKLWIAEGILEPDSSQIAEDFATECLWELVDKSLVMLQQRASNLGIKIWRLHSTVWHLSSSEAVKIKFFHALNSFDDSLIEGIESQRRLCIRNNVLLGIQDVHESLSSMSTARSILCTGPFHQYPVPIPVGSRFLRVLDALTIFFYEFPLEVVKLFFLKYLAITFDGKLPTSISEIKNLEYLIVSRRTSVASSDNLLCLPQDIWDMKELKYLQIMGRQLPTPDSDILLPNLSTLLEVSAQSCSKDVLISVPNLKRLGIRIEMSPDDDGQSIQHLNHISCLDRLESLKCVVTNPGPNFESFAPPAPISMFSSSLKKLSLSGLGYPWEYMDIIAELPSLEVLKLRCYAFRGPEWEISHTGFKKLRYLLIEDTDLVQWKCKRAGLGQLEHLSVKHCYKLKELPSMFLDRIEAVDCNPTVVTWAKEMLKMRRPLGPKELRVQAVSSWETK